MFNIFSIKFLLLLLITKYIMLLYFMRLIHICSISAAKVVTWRRAYALHEGGHFAREICYPASARVGHLPDKVLNKKKLFSAAHIETYGRLAG